MANRLFYEFYETDPLALGYLTPLYDCLKAV